MYNFTPSTLPFQQEMPCGTSSSKLDCDSDSVKFSEDVWEVVEPTPRPTRLPASTDSEIELTSMKTDFDVESGEYIHAAPEEIAKDEEEDHSTADDIVSLMKDERPPMEEPAPSVFLLIFSAIYKFFARKKMQLNKNVSRLGRWGKRVCRLRNCEFLIYPWTTYKRFCARVKRTIAGGARRIRRGVVAPVVCVGRVAKSVLGAARGITSSKNETPSAVGELHKGGEEKDQSEIGQASGKVPSFHAEEAGCAAGRGKVQAAKALALMAPFFADTRRTPTRVVQKASIPVEKETASFDAHAFAQARPFFVQVWENEKAATHPSLLYV